MTMEWQWEVYEDLKLEMPIASGRIRNGLQKTPLEIVSEMVRAQAAVNWAYVECVEVDPFDHDGTQKSLHFLSTGEQWRAEISPV